MTLPAHPDSYYAATAIGLEDHPALSGAWQEPSGLIGSPVTYGPYLATYMARRSLVQTGVPRYAEPIARADAWFRRVPVRTVLAAAATLLALDGAGDADATAVREVCMDVVRRGESPSGGWGPFVNSLPILVVLNVFTPWR